MERQKCPRIKVCFASLVIGLVASSLVWPDIAAATPMSLGDDPSTLGRADRLVARGLPNQAISLLAAGLQQHPDQHFLRIRLADLYLLDNRVGAAQTLLTDARKRYPKSLATVLLGATMAIKPLALHDSDPESENITLAKLKRLDVQARALDPRHPITQYIEGWMARLSGDNQAAETDFRQALADYPNFLKALQALIDVEMDRNRIPQAVPYMGQLLELAPDDNDTQFLAGRLSMARGNPAKALACFKQAQGSKPHPATQWRMAEAERKLGHPEIALKYVQAVAKAWPNRPDVFQLQADLLTGLHRDTEATVAITKTVQLQPTALGPLVTDAEKRFWTVSPEAGVDEYLRLLSIAPDRDDLLTIVIQTEFRLWQESYAMDNGRLDGLENLLRETKPAYSSPAAMQLAEVQLQILRGNTWSPGLLAVVGQMVQSPDVPADVRARGAMMLGDSVTAKSLWKTPETNKRQAVQFAVLTGAWALAKNWVGQDVALSDLTAPVNKWATTQQRNAATAKQQTESYIQMGRIQEAQDAVLKAKLYEPFSPSIAVLEAEVAFKSGDATSARRGLASAITLGATPANSPRLPMLQDALRQPGRSAGPDPRARKSRTR